MRKLLSFLLPVLALAATAVPAGAGGKLTIYT